MLLPYLQTDNPTLNLLITKWRSVINPFLTNPSNDSSILEGISLANGVNVINHKLGKVPQGWIITDTNASINVYRSAPFNDLTLTLTCSAVATVSIEVF